MQPSNLTYQMCVLALSGALNLGAQGAGIVEGVVVNSVSRAALAGVTVELTAQGAAEPAYRATTDSGGAFRVATVAEPGIWRRTNWPASRLRIATRPNRHST